MGTEEKEPTKHKKKKKRCGTVYWQLAFYPKMLYQVSDLTHWKNSTFIIIYREKV